mgnify:CR=1 FL=1
MGHNRGWEEAASIFSGLAVELKTANAALLQTSATSWQEVFSFVIISANVLSKDGLFWWGNLDLDL